MALSKECYDTSGKGFCVVLANFTDGNYKLTGYQHDIEGIEELFTRNQQFDVESADIFYDLSQSRFRNALESIQHCITNSEERYSFFLMFVLSHGCEEGFVMCEENTYRPEKNTDGTLCCIHEDEIIQSFTHDKVPKLRDIPKCFFFQACRDLGKLKLLPELSVLHTSSVKKPGYHHLTF